MKEARARAGILACTRGAGQLEYILLIGAVVLIAIGAFKLFGSTVKGTISGQAASVEALEEGRAGDGADRGAQGPSAQGNSTNTAANENGAAPADSAKSARRASAGRAEGEAATADEDGKMSASAKVTTTVPVSDGPVLTNAPRADEGLKFDYGWVLAGAGAVALVAVLFKGKRQAQADAGADKKK